MSVDSKEENNLFDERTEIAQRLKAAMDRWNESLAASVPGKDYPEGTVDPGEPEPRFWMDVDAYRPYFDQWKERPEYASRLKPKKRKPGVVRRQSDSWLFAWRKFQLANRFEAAGSSIDQCQIGWPGLD